jgi:hypothetical protein
MTSLQGTDTAYSSISGNYLALAPDCSDTIFGTDINYCSLVKAGTNPYGFMKGTFVDGNEEDPSVLNQYSTLLTNFNKKLAESIPLQKKPPKSIYDLLQIIPNVSETLKLVNDSNFSDYLSTPPIGNSIGITFIAPTNSFVKKARNTWFTTKNKPMINAILKAHLLNFVLAPKTLENRLLKVYTHNPSFSFISDGTGNIVNYLNFYQQPVTLLNNEYSLKYDRFKVVETYMTENGILYVIDGMFLPEIINYSIY